MRKGLIAVAGIIIVACIIAGIAVYIYSHYKPYRNISRKTSTVEELRGIAEKGLSMDNLKSYFVRLKSERAVITGKLEKLRNPASNLSLIVALYGRDIEYGYMRNSTCIVRYGHVGNLTILFKTYSTYILNSQYPESDIESARLDFQLLNATILYIRRTSSPSIEYCVKGELQIVFGNSRRILNVERCIELRAISFGHSFIAFLYVMYPTIITKLALLGVHDILPALVKKVEYLGEKNIGGEVCKMYRINQNIDISKLLENTTLVRTILNNLKNLFNININVSNALEIVNNAVTTIRHVGLDKWHLETSFCIDNAGLLTYLNSYIYNINKKLFNMRFKIYIYVNSRKTYKNYINRELLEKALKLHNLHKVGIYSPENFLTAWLSYIAFSNSPATSIISVFEITYMLSTFQASSEVVTYGASGSLSIIHNSVIIAMQNLGNAPISRIVINILEKGRTIGTIVVTCSKPLLSNSNLRIVCSPGKSCKTEIEGHGECRAHGIFPSLKKNVKYNIVSYVTFVNGKNVKLTLGTVS